MRRGPASPRFLSAVSQVLLWRHARWHRLHHARRHWCWRLPHGPENPSDEAQNEANDETSQSIEEAHDGEHNHQDTPDHVLLGLYVQQDTEDHHEQSVHDSDDAKEGHHIRATPWDSRQATHDPTDRRNQYPVQKNEDPTDQRQR